MSSSYGSSPFFGRASNSRNMFSYPPSESRSKPKGPRRTSSPTASAFVLPQRRCAEESYRQPAGRYASPSILPVERFVKRQNVSAPDSPVSKRTVILVVRDEPSA